MKEAVTGEVNVGDDLVLKLSGRFRSTYLIVLHNVGVKYIMYQVLPMYFL